MAPVNPVERALAWRTPAFQIIPHIGTAMDSSGPTTLLLPPMTRIAFLAFAEAHQHLHWLPAALRLAAEPGVAVDVLGASRAGLKLVERFDPERRLTLIHLATPSHRADGLFSPPPRALAALLHQHRFLRYDAIATTETSSSVLKRLPWFTVPMIHLKHGAGDSAVGYNIKHRHFDLTLVNGPKDKERLIAKRLARPDEAAVVGYAKFELVAPPAPLFADGKPVALYNPHAKLPGSTWFAHGPALVAEMERIANWNFVVAPHVKLKRGPAVTSTAANVRIDMGSMASIDMSYTQGADVYIGDASSQVYEFLRQPRPCIFLNLDHLDWQGEERFSHWSLGQVIEEVGELGPALDRAAALQPRFESLQRAALAHSLDPSDELASDRQAEAILAFIKARARP